MSIRVLLADDHQMCRDGFRALIDREPDMCVVAEAANGREAVAQADRCKPDVAVLDVAMPGRNGIDATRALSARLPETGVIGLSMHADRQYVARMLEAGARGYLLKSCASRELIEAIRAVAEGRTFITPSLLEAVVETCMHGRFETVGLEDLHRLSNREQEVLRWVAEGFSSRQIAEKLGITVRTVDAHRQRVMQKLQIDSVAGLTKYAIRQGLTTVQA
jgi:DNA-binding NarL/FixJ family response regulator